MLENNPAGSPGEGVNSFPAKKDFRGFVYLPLLQTLASLPVSFHGTTHLEPAGTHFFLTASARLAPWTGTHEAISKTISLGGTIYSLLCACQQSS